MYNELIKIGPVTIYGYGFMIAAGILCALWMTARRAQKKDVNIDIVLQLGADRAPVWVYRGKAVVLHR